MEILISQTSYKEDIYNDYIIVTCKGNIVSNMG